jgi:hypothetical protein
MLTNQYEYYLIGKLIIDLNWSKFGRDNWGNLFDFINTIIELTSYFQL